MYFSTDRMYINLQQKTQTQTTHVSHKKKKVDSQDVQTLKHIVGFEFSSNNDINNLNIGLQTNNM